MINNRVSLPANLLLNLFFIFCVVLCLYPLLLVIGISFTDNEALRDGYRIIPQKFSTEGYTFVFNTSDTIFRAYGVTIFNTAVGTFLHVLIVSLFAYPLSRPEFRSRKFFMGFILIPMLFTPQPLDPYRAQRHVQAVR